MKPHRTLPCPTCQKVGSWFDSRFGPFCSERCKLVDLGKWLGEEYRISRPLSPEDWEKIEAQEIADGFPAPDTES